MLASDTFARLWQLTVLIIFTMCLSSCSTTVKKDGPPNYEVDVSKIPDAVPKHEPRAKYGNMSSYTVFGKRYYTLRSSKHYDKVGIASWYGSKFHSRLTSSGERYSMLEMTAAHPTLPLPTYVRVTNLRNNRQVIVKVNDRGPFESRRLIDLSYVAAKKLGMLASGTARVRVQAIDPTTKHVYLASNHSFTKRFKNAKQTMLVYLQVGAFKSRLHAEKLKNRLAQLLSQPIIITKRQLYRVKVGPINDLATAEKISDRLNGLGIKSNKVYGA